MGEEACATKVVRVSKLFALRVGFFCSYLDFDSHISLLDFIAPQMVTKPCQHNKWHTVCDLLLQQRQ